jgi:hypothetical protein
MKVIMIVNVWVMCQCKKLSSPYANVRTAKIEHWDSIIQRYCDLITD